MNTVRKWEDPATWSDWIARLAANLVTLDQQYVGIKGIEQMQIDPHELDNPELLSSDPRANATLTAAAALARVIEALAEIPTFQDDSFGLVALRDVAIALADVDAGNKPKMFTPRPDTFAPKDGVGRRLVKASVILCVELLEASGDRRARETAAKIFRSAGFKGRKGAPLSAKSLETWETDLGCVGPDQKMRALIDRDVDRWRSAYGWPPKREEVIKFTKERARDPNLLVKI